jgi:putative DNA primase/helicase
MTTNGDGKHPWTGKPPRKPLIEPKTNSGPNGSKGAEGGGDIDAAIARLRALPPLDYERERKAAAKRLGIRVTQLDRLVRGNDGGGSNNKGNGKAGQGRPLEFPELEPWPDYVDGAELLDAIAATYCDYVVMPEGAADVLALWVVHTHAREVAVVFPRVIFTSSEMRSGKTTALNITGNMAAQPLFSANTSAAAVYRAIEAWAPTLLVDEADTFLSDDNELRGIFNAGFQLGGGVLRVIGDDHELRWFPCDGPFASAGLGKLHPTMSDRAFVITMRRRRRDEKVERFRITRLDPFKRLARKAARWARDHLDRLREADDPDVPEELHDRAQDCARPLLAIADTAGGEWPERARRAVLALAQSVEDSSSTRVLLLSDLRELFDAEPASGVLFTAEIIAKLVSRDDRPWGEYGKKRLPITSRQIAALLKPFGIATHQTVRRGDTTNKGYRREDLEDTFARYLPPPIGQQ